MKFVAFVPIKLNSERLPLKNIKSFDNGGPLIKYILQTLLKVEELDEIYVYCSDERIKDYLPEGIKFLKRDKIYDLSETKFNAVLQSFAEIVESDYYILAHATAPFISANTIRAGIKSIVHGEFDSALTVSKLSDFLWVEGKPFNYNPNNIPRTQDLPDIFAETCGLYIYSKDLILNGNTRIGNNPKLIEVDKFEACDINTEEDWVIANALFNSYYNRTKE